MQELSGHISTVATSKEQIRRSYVRSKFEIALVDFLRQKRIITPQNERYSAVLPEQQLFIPV